VAKAEQVTDVMFKLKDIIGTVMTTKKHPIETFTKIATLGKEVPASPADVNLRWRRSFAVHVGSVLGPGCVAHHLSGVRGERHGPRHDISMNAQQMELFDKICSHDQSANEQS